MASRRGSRSAVAAPATGAEPQRKTPDGCISELLQQRQTGRVDEAHFRAVDRPFTLVAACRFGVHTMSLAASTAAGPGRFRAGGVTAARHRPRATRRST